MENCKEKQDNGAKKFSNKISIFPDSLTRSLLLLMADIPELGGSGNLHLRKRKKEGEQLGAGGILRREAIVFILGFLLHHQQPLPGSQESGLGFMALFCSSQAGPSCSSPQPGVKATSCPQNALWDLPMSWAASGGRHSATGRGVPAFSGVLSQCWAALDAGNRSPHGAEAWLLVSCTIWKRGLGSLETNATFPPESVLHHLT